MQERLSKPMRPGFISQQLAERIESGELNGKRIVALALAANQTAPGMEWPDELRWHEYYEFGESQGES